MNLIILQKSRKRKPAKRKVARKKPSTKKEKYNVNGVGELSFISADKKGIKEKNNLVVKKEKNTSVDNDTYWTKSKYERYIKAVGDALKGNVKEGIKWTDPSFMAQEMAEGIIMEKPNLKVYLRKMGVKVGYEAEKLAEDIYRQSIK